MKKYLNLNDDTIWDENDMKKYHDDFKSQGLYLINYDDFIECMLENDFIEL